VGEASYKRRRRAYSPATSSPSRPRLQRIYILFFISLATRRIEYIACTSNPDGRWVAQQARNLVMQLGDEQPFRFLIHDRDAKVSHVFDEVLRSEGIKVIRTPVQAPNANAYAASWGGACASGSRRHRMAGGSQSTARARRGS
jgi:hypothetical protein